MRRPLSDNTQHSQLTDIHFPGGIRTHNPSKRAAADPPLRPRDHWDRDSKTYTYVFIYNHTGLKPRSLVLPQREKNYGPRTEIFETIHWYFLQLSPFDCHTAVVGNFTETCHRTLHNTGSSKIHPAVEHTPHITVLHTPITTACNTWVEFCSRPACHL
jgi:hypothetical protein